MALPSLTLRNIKGTALTFSEMDTNLTNLQTANLTVSVTGGSVTSLALNSTLAFTAGSGITLTNNSGNITVAADAVSDYGNAQVAAYLVANPEPGTYGNTQVTSFLAGNITVGNITGSVEGFAIGYRNMPQVTAGNVTLALTDSGKHFYSNYEGPTTITIPLDSSVDFDIGTVITIVNGGPANVALALEDIEETELYLGGNAVIDGRTVTAYGVATLIKVDTDVWFINGVGVI